MLLMLLMLLMMLVMRIELLAQFNSFSLFSSIGASTPSPSPTPPPPSTASTSSQQQGSGTSRTARGMSVGSGDSGMIEATLAPVSPMRAVAPILLSSPANKFSLNDWTYSTSPSTSTSTTSISSTSVSLPLSSRARSTSIPVVLSSTTTSTLTTPLRSTAPEFDPASVFNVRRRALPITSLSTASISSSGLPTSTLAELGRTRSLTMPNYSSNSFSQTTTKINDHNVYQHHYPQYEQYNVEELVSSPSALPHAPGGPSFGRAWNGSDLCGENRYGGQHETDYITHNTYAQSSQRQQQDKDKGGMRGWSPRSGIPLRPSYNNTSSNRGDRALSATAPPWLRMSNHFHFFICIFTR
jgi:hypothetical protein